MIILKNAYLQLGWILKGNQKFGRKSTGAQIPKKIVSLLQGFFLVRNANKSNRYHPTNKYVRVQARIYALPSQHKSSLSPCEGEKEVSCK